MGHPMHLHGHKFWILGSGEGDFPYSSVQDVPSSLANLDDPPYRDTVELPASGWAVIRLDPPPRGTILDQILRFTDAL